MLVSGLPDDQTPLLIQLRNRSSLQFQVSTSDHSFHCPLPCSKMSKPMFGKPTSTAALLLQLLAVISLLLMSSVNGALIGISNQCGETITACATCCGGGQVNCYVLGNNGGYQQLNVGGDWPGGIVWAFPGNSGSPSDGNNAKPQANLAEFTIGSSGVDYYDISNVNAYNLAMSVAPTFIAGGGSPSGTYCENIVCNVGNLNSFCQPPNSLTGPPGYGCYNTDGPGNNPTPGTRAFKNACPTSYSYSQDNAGDVAGCPTGSNYQVTFCP